MSLNGFDHKLLKFIRDDYKSFEGQKVTVACSGGVDSVALLISLNKIKPLLKCEVGLLHIHHGDLSEELYFKQNKFREEALDFCHKLANHLGISFEVCRSKDPLKKEEECRDFRSSAFKDFKNVFLGHHKDDFLETILLRLIRGTGPQGLIDPFSSSDLYRPFLNLFKKEEILMYLKDENQSYIDDPSNFEEDALRNWVRNVWLKDLEKQSGINGLSKSIHLISQALETSLKPEQEAISFGDQSHSSGSLDISLWLSLSQFQKQSTIAHILLKTIKKGYTKGHIDEVIKCLDSSQKEDHFKLCDLSWTKGLESIIFEKL